MSRGAAARTLRATGRSAQLRGDDGRARGCECLAATSDRPGGSVLLTIVRSSWESGAPRIIAVGRIWRAEFGRADLHEAGEWVRPVKDPCD